MNNVYQMVKNFKNKYPKCVTWYRLKKHCAVVEKHLNPGEKVNYIIAGQLDNDCWSLFNTGVMAITNERLVIAQNRLIIGYRFSSITPDLYNDMQVDSGLFWGTICIDTIKEKVYISNLDKKCLAEAETKISMFMQENKKKYKDREDDDK